jgi:AraC-like DNA-binding protein
MKPHLLKVLTYTSESFNARQDKSPDINNHWHYHREIELVCFKRGRGTQFVGDSITQFKPGDIVLIGPNLPHYWRFDKSYFGDQEEERADVNVIHFTEDFWGKTFLELPENSVVRNLLNISKRGIQIMGDKNEQIITLINDIIDAKGAKKLMHFIEVLVLIAESDHNKPLTTAGFQYNLEEAEKTRINAIYDYSINNFKRKITLNEIAAVANMSVNSFCKYFKTKNRKTYSHFVNELRVGYACKLLIDTELSVKQVTYESGFSNFTSFHKHFKIITGKSPLSYQKTHAA